MYSSKTRFSFYVSLPFDKYPSPLRHYSSLFFFLLFFRLFLPLRHIRGQTSGVLILPMRFFSSFCLRALRFTCCFFFFFPFPQAFESLFLVSVVLFFFFSPSLSTLLFHLQLGEGRGGSTPTHPHTPRRRHTPNGHPLRCSFRWREGKESSPHDGQRGAEGYVLSIESARFAFGSSCSFSSLRLRRSTCTVFSFFFFLFRSYSFFCAVCVRVSALCAVFRVHIGCRRVCECL